MWLTAAQTSLDRRDDAAWQTAADGQTRWWVQELALPQGRERWVVVRAQAGERQARATLEQQAGKARDDWRKRLWHLSHRAFACEADARVALAQETKTWPTWLKLAAGPGARRAALHSAWCCACSSTGAPSTAYASGWRPLVRRSPTRSRSRRTGPRCAGCSSFQCFEGIALLHIRHGLGAVTSLILRLTPLHQQILALLGPTCEQCYESSH